MNCPEYQEMVAYEQWEIIGKVVHLLQNDSESFKAMKSMVRNAESKGLFEGVKILPQQTTNLIDDNFQELID